MYDLKTRLRAAMPRRRRRYSYSRVAGRQVERRRQPDIGRNGLVDQGVERRHADRGEHLVARGRIGPDVSRLEAAGVRAVGIGVVLQIGVLADVL